MRTPVILVAGQTGTARITGTFADAAGVQVVGYEYDGHVVRRWVAMAQGGDVSAAELPLELVDGCVSLTVCNDLLVLLRRLHRRIHVGRIVVQLPAWVEPEPICCAINTVRVHVGPGYIDGPAARDVRVEAVVTAVDSDRWLNQAVGADDGHDGRTQAEIVVGQTEVADVLVLCKFGATLLEVLWRLAPSAHILVGADGAEDALRHPQPATRRGIGRRPHDPLLAGEPPLEPAGPVHVVEFNAQRPFHPQRLHNALDMLLEGVVRAWGRGFLANRLDDVLWIESAGGGLRVDHAGTWLAAMSPGELAYCDPQRRALASMRWDARFGDRHIAIAILVCGAQPAEITHALKTALLTDDELSRPDEWAKYADPFGDLYDDPCQDLRDAVDEAAVRCAYEGEER